MKPTCLRVVEDKKSRFLQFRFEGPDGKTHQVSSGCTELAEAMKVAATGDLLATALKGKLLIGRQFLVLVRLMYQLFCGKQLSVVSVEDYCAEWLASVKSLREESTARTQESAIRLFLEHMSREGLLMDDVKPRHIKAFAVFLEARNNVPSTINGRLDIINTLFNDALRDGIIERNPAKGIRAPDRIADAEEEELKRQPFQRVQIRSMTDKSLVAGCNPELAVITLVDLDVGARIGDAFAMRRGFYTRETGELRYYVRKAKKWHTVVLFPATQALLNEYIDHHLPDNNSNAPLYPTFAIPAGPEVAYKEYQYGSAAVSGHYAHFLKAIGLRPDEIDEPEENAKRTHHDYAFHSCRATANTAMKKAGIPEGIVMARLCHKTVKANKKYDRFNVYNVCRHTYEGLGLDTALSLKVLEASSITMAEIFEEMDYARQKLVELRGKLDIQVDDEIAFGAKARRARLEPAE